MTTPNNLAINGARLKRSLFCIPCTWPFLIMFIASYPGIGSPSCLKRKEAHRWLDQAFDETMVLFDQIVEILPLLQFTRCSKVPSCLQFLNDLWIGSMFLSRDDPW